MGATRVFLYPDPGGGLMIICTKANPFAVLVMFFALTLAPVEELQAYAMASASQDQKQQTADTQSKELVCAEGP
jgi:hypothetical protein